MKKMFAVLKREYLQAVRKKMFIIMTFLMPLLMAGLMVVPGLLMARGMGEKKVAVLDATGRLQQAFAQNSDEEDDDAKPARQKDAEKEMSSSVKIDYVNATGRTDLEAMAKPYLDKLISPKKEGRIDGVFLIPADTMTSSDAKMKFYSRSATDFITQQRLGSTANRTIQRFRLQGRGISDPEIENIMKRAKVDAVQYSKSGEQKSSGAANFMIGFVFTALLVLPSFIYGLEIMRGIIQEKSDRVVEVLISSMSPVQLLVGKILGVAAVGLTQISAWLLMAGAGAAFGATTAALAGVNVLQLLRPATFIYFVIFFILAYMTFVCVYAIGGAVCNSEKEAQQMIAPITMTMMLPWFLLVGIITSPDSSMAVGLSLAPVFGPITMFVRTLVSEPPMWHILVSIAVSLATVAVFFWATAKIFRVGILSYGKRPTIPELMRWIRMA
jgi:ABC-2 type transport system permease protein